MTAFHRHSLLAFLALSFWSADAFACKCDRINPVREAAMGFFGTVEKIRQRGSTDAALFKVENVYKGDEKDAVNVYTNRFHHDCGIRFEEGKSYVVYAYDFRPRGVATSQCWKTYEAESAPTPAEWKTPKGEISEATELEAELRKLARRIVPRCGRKHRVKDAGFSMIMSSSGDPVRREPEENVPDDVASFQRCVVDEFVQKDELPQPDDPVRIEGWFQYGDRHVPVLLDELPCGENCNDWGARVRNAMVAPPKPPYDDDTLMRAFESCVEEGPEAVEEEGSGRKRSRVLVDCALRRGEFAKAMEHVETANLDPALAVAIEWAVATSTDGGYPVGQAEPTYHDYWFDGKRGSPTGGKFRVLRNAFVGSTQWSHQPLYLEAFAESVLGDENAPEKMRDIAAVAYHRAAMLMPEKADEYAARATDVSDTKRARMMMDEITKVLEEAKPKPKEEPPPEELEPAPPEVPQANVEEGGGGDSQNLLYIGAGLVLLAMIGIFLIKTRST